jgi:hypothetical protein
LNFYKPASAATELKSDKKADAQLQHELEILRGLSATR